MKRLILPILLLATLGALAGCTLFGNNGTLVLIVPESGYPPFEATIEAVGMTGGQYTFKVEGNTYTQPENILIVMINFLPADITVTWVGFGGASQTATATIALENRGPVPGPVVLNGIRDLWTIHPKQRYIVTFPDAYDPEGGPVRLVNATVYHEGQQMENTVFCPPYTGANPPTIDLYRVRLGSGDIYNAFIFFSIWNGLLDEGGYISPEYDPLMKYKLGDKVRVGATAYECKVGSVKGVKPGVDPDWWKKWRELGPAATTGTVMPYAPPGQGMSGYLGSPTNCPPFWPKNFVPAGMTVITTVWEDEQGDRTTQVDEIPTMQYPGC